MAKASSTSRKGKRAWRKNVDVADVDQALDAKREKEILLGAEDDDFVIDTQGDQKHKRQKVLKATEILRNKSKVPALGERLKNKPVLKKRADALMVLSGKLLTGNKFKATVARDGILRGDSTDLWSDAPASEPRVPIVSPSQPSTSYSVPQKAPVTLLEKPLHLTSRTARDIADFEDGGKSYNPALDEWKKLIDHEFGNESTLEEKRQKMEEHQKRIEYLIETLEDNEVQDMDDAADEQDEAAGADIDDEEKYRLSVNPRTEVKTKTRTQRNKEARRKQSQELHRKLRELKAQIADLNRLDEIQQEVTEKISNTKTAKPKEYKRHGKHDASFTPIEVKLSDELAGSLRSLRPEGNLLYDLMHKLQTQGKVEARVPVVRKRKFKMKFVGKRTMKDP